jgi:hypothetical protein
MPAGERSQVWYPELVALLRAEWRSDLPWEAVVQLRDRLQSQLEAVRAERGILPPVMRCAHCGATGHEAPPVISVRAVLLALGRFEIAAQELVRQRERAWTRHRSEHNLDLVGRPALSRASAPPQVHRH